MKYITEQDILYAFESVRPGELVRILCKWEHDLEGSTGQVIEKCPNGYYDIGWCIRLKLEPLGYMVEIFRSSIAYFEFLSNDDPQMNLPFEDENGQYPLEF